MLKYISIPALITAFGAILATVGAFWSSITSQQKDIELLTKSERISALSDEIAQSITGGDTHPYIIPFIVNGKLHMMPTNSGKYPIYDVNVRIVDQDRFTIMVKQSTNLPRDIFNINQRCSTVLPAIGNLSPKQGKDVFVTPLDTNTPKNLGVFMLARNGEVNEEVKLRFVEVKWAVAYKAYNQNGIISEKIDEDYPKDQLLQ